MTSTLRSRARLLAGAIATLAVAAASVPAQAQIVNMANVPLNIGGSNIRPIVMFSMTKDQELHKRAYSDYSDLDGDGVFETTYKHSINYYGYFDPFKCYSYSVANARFEPQADTSGLAAANQKYCDTVAGDWSGNFLNWATMTRVDALRKVLYGGLRSPSGTRDAIVLADGDSTTGTVLERAYLPMDAHAFAKYYDGTDIARLTPYTPTVVRTTSTTSRTIPTTLPTTAATDLVFTLPTGGVAAASIAVNDFIEAADTASPNTRWVRGQVTAIATNNVTLRVYFTSGSGTNANWTIKNLRDGGITMCNTTPSDGTAANQKSQTNTKLPRMRLVPGNYSLWAANERWQCSWNTGEANGSNSNDFTITGIAAFGSSPTLSPVTFGTTPGDYVVRIQACVAGLLGTEKCKQYPNGTYKPIGLLQVYGEPNLIDFGLVTGSYRKNVSGGVLRKNAGTINNEIVANTGQFTVPAGGNIIDTIGRLRIFGYNYGAPFTDGTYLGAAGDNCTFGLTSLTEGQCQSWGNPMSEIYYETLRYLAGGQPKVSGNPQPTAAYNFTLAGTADNTLGLPIATWADPLNNTNYCAPLNIINFNSSVSTDDNNQIPASSTKTYLGTQNLSTTINSTVNAETLTKNVGDFEGITGNQYFIGRMGASTNEYCDGKTITNLGQASGLCPEGPTKAGSFLMAGLAYHARVNRIRSDLTVSTLQPKALQVATYALQLSSNNPTLNIRVPGSATNQTIILQPACRLTSGTNSGGCALVDMRVVSQEITSTYERGKLMLNWEDSEQGGDYDQDMWGVLDYCINGATAGCGGGQPVNTIRITTRSPFQSTPSAMGFGFVISGTTADGPHFYSGINSFSYTNPAPITVTPATNVTAAGGCSSCVSGNPAKTATFSFNTTGAGARPLKDPLWYAAKYGGFQEASGTGNNIPDLVAEWDSKDVNGNPGSDGIPDNYFNITNPLGLETSLDKTFVAILTTSSAASVATNSTSLNTGSRIYQARFNSSDWSGQLQSKTIDTNGVIGSTAEWDAGQQINAQDWNTGRTIITMDPTLRTGIPFRWTSISAAQQTALNTNAANSDDGQGQARLQWLRGDPSNEGVGAANYRRRVNSKLGDIVHSFPQYIGPPSQAYADAAYLTFKSTYANRKPMLAAGANDGMLHIFDAGTNLATAGKELLGYVPNRTFYKLSWLTEKNYNHRYFVDGTPAVSDVYINGQWRTVLVGSYGAGGQGVFALDITDPTQFTEANAANLLLWEFTDQDYVGVGNTFGQVKIGKMNNGKWAAIVHGGFNSTYGCSSVPCTGGGDYLDTASSVTGQGRVYVIFIENGIGATSWSGSDFVILNTRVGSATTPNATATPVLLDSNGDGTVDYIYFGDQVGNLWKWDVTNGSPSNWKPAFGTVASPTPLYAARDASNVAQPITSAPELFPHPNGGYLVYFGTGQYVQQTDVASPYQLQTMYGIWDKPAAGAVASITTRPASSPLVAQSVLATATTAAGTARVVSQNAVDYTNPLIRGWYMDMPNSATTGERIVDDPFVQTGKLVFQPLTPSSAQCDAGGTSFLMEVDPLTGGRLTFSAFDINGDKGFSSGDYVMYGGVAVPVSGVQTSVGITPKATVISGGPNKEYKVLSGSTGGLQVILENPNPGATTSIQRRAWREIFRN